MVQTPAKRMAYFAAFTVPALALYGLFFISPFLQGIRISFTNWDGLTPKTPISMEKAEFEEKVLSRIESVEDRDFVLSVYSLDPTGTYSRLSIRGAERNRLSRILARSGYEPESYRGVGLANYKSIFTRGVDERFYPRRYEKTYYNENSSLPQAVDATEWETIFLANLDAEGKALAGQYYGRSGDEYLLAPSKDEFALEDGIWLLPEVESGRIDSGSVDALLTDVRRAGLERDSAAADAAIDAFLAEAFLSPDGYETARRAARAIYDLGVFKRLLASTWREPKFELGVVGFTLFFTLFNVIAANLLAFLLALALDTRLRSRNVLRSVFFLPNVLSMIVVALIWSFVFFHLLPRLTGIERWMSDPAKTPWLLVMVSTWQAAGYYMIIYLAGLQNIPGEVREAALIDGASPTQVLRAITLPLLMPAFTVCLFLSIANSLKSFDLVYAMVGPTGYTLGTVPYVMDIYFDAFARKLAGLSTAKATLLFLLILSITGVQLSIMKKREVQL